VDIRFGVTKQHLPEGGIVAHGPHRADAIAVGYVFETNAADGAYAAVTDRLAPQGYSYLLISGGRGTLASCMFGDFHNERTYLERTVDYFQERVGIEMRNPRRFGGFGNVVPEPTARRGRLLFAGEAAGFQDALFGFGMRYSMLSGHFAAQAFLANRVTEYDKLVRHRFGGLLKMAIVNRYLYERLGDRGYSRLLRQIDRAADTREWLRRFYGSGWRQYVFYRLALKQRARRRALIKDCPESCDCTWCQCERHRDDTDPGAHKVSPLDS
jgi:flavin-dependent dehydrogenase